MKEGRGGTGKGVSLEKESAATLPYRLSLPETVHFFTLGDKALWVLMLRVKGHGSRGDHGVVHHARTRTRTLYVCHVFFEKQVFRPDGWGLKGGE